MEEILCNMTVINKIKLYYFNHFQNILPLLLPPMTLATSVEKTLCDILSKERVIGLT